MTSPIKSRMPIQHWIVRPDGMEFPLHTYSWIKEIRIRGLGIPNMNSEDDIILERGSQQHGSTAVLFKLPETRPWALELSVSEKDELMLEQNAEDVLFDIFNPLYAAYGLFTIPNPWIYKRISTGNRRRQIRFFLESGLQEDITRTYPRIELEMTSPQVFLFDDLQKGLEEGGFTYDHTDAFGNKYYLSNGSITYDGTWITCPVLLIDLPLDPPHAISRIGWKNMDTGESYLMSYWDWQEGNGWPELQDAVDQVELNICNRTFQTGEITNNIYVGGALAGATVIEVQFPPYAARAGSPIRVILNGGAVIHYTTIVDADVGANEISLQDPLPVNAISGDDVIYGPVNLAGTLHLPNWDAMQLIPGTYRVWFVLEQTFLEEAFAAVIASFSFEPHYIGIYR